MMITEDIMFVLLPYSLEDFDNITATWVDENNNEVPAPEDSVKYLLFKWRKKGEML